MSYKIVAVTAVSFSMLVLVPCFSYAAVEEKSEAFWKEKKQAWHEKKIQELVTELNLTPQQQEQIEARRKTQDEQQRQVRLRIKELHGILREELEKPTVDISKVEGLKAELKDLMAQQVDHRVDSILGIKGILTPEQFQKFQQRMQEKRERFKDERGEGPRKRGTDGPRMKAGEGRK